MARLLKIALLLAATTSLAQSVQAQPGSGPGNGGGPGGGRGMNMMQMVDADKDGKISLSEYTTMARMRWQRIAQGADTVTLANLMPMQKGAFTGITPAADGTVSKAAYDAAVPARFKAADSNGDGSLDQPEMMATMAPPGGMAGMGGMRRQGN